jgi:hypothetical protein
MGNSFTAILTKVLPFLSLVVTDCTTDLLSDLDTIVNDVTANVPGERDWVLEGLGHLLKLIPVSLAIFAFLHGLLDFLNESTDVLDSSEDI